MSQTQYKTLISNLLNEKHALTKLRAKLEGRKGKLCRSCRGFRHLAQNCRNKREEEKGTVIPQNKFEILRNRVMQCGVEGRIIRRVEVIEVECFKCGEKGHKCKECPLWEKKEKAVRVAKPQKAQQERLACPVKGKVQEKEKELRRVGEGEVAHVAEPQEA